MIGARSPPSLGAIWIGRAGRRRRMAMVVLLMPAAGQHLVEGVQSPDPHLDQAFS
jgi:hypothetical protein